MLNKFEVDIKKETAIIYRTDKKEAKQYFYSRMIDLMDMNDHINRNNPHHPINFKRGK